MDKTVAVSLTCPKCLGSGKHPCGVCYTCNGAGTIGRMTTTVAKLAATRAAADLYSAARRALGASLSAARAWVTEQPTSARVSAMWAALGDEGMTDEAARLYAWAARRGIA